MAHPLLQLVRQRYGFRCGYCGVSETDVGGELSIDHFRPLSDGGDESDDNLVYSCIRCNQHKGALRPDHSDAGQSNRLLHPLRDDLSLHIQEDPNTGQLDGLTPQGLFHIQALRLNRPPLVAHRLRTQLIQLLEARLEQSETEVESLRNRIKQREEYIRYLERRVRGNR